MKRLLKRIICNPSTSALGFLALILTCAVWMIPGLPTEAQATVSAVLVLFARKCLLTEDPKPPVP